MLKRRLILRLTWNAAVFTQEVVKHNTPEIESYLRPRWKWL